uniref:Fungal lipase-type domain-containing protein n=1 Tax=Globisporangium ultimum (strain ATCC 200006 / CBS 805.95 / DAOM BR144) TaxID=431595 RepID=K3WDS6_GLOUD
MGKLLKHVRVCDAVYASTISGFCQESGVERENIVKYHNGGVLSPKYILLLDHKSREIVVVVRGSASIMDFCTDLCLVNEPFESGEGHRGMVHAAKWLANHLKDDLERLTAEYPEYQLITTGHSLGAAVAAIATMALKQNFPRVHCYAFATPASVTRNLAEECYDYVTSVVAGDDCVPRLHQHSIYKLQGEVSKFDWRNTLKQMVTEEVAEQTTFVQKQKDEKLEQIYQAIRKFEELSIKQQNDALEKIDQVKRLATENIAEFTSEIDRRVVKTIDSTLSPFRADKISLNHIKFVQNLLKADEKEKFPFLWQKLDSSVLVLERLSASVNKPEQLERLIKESKELLKHTTPATKKIASTMSDVVPPLMLLRDRINNVIVQATDSLKSEVKGT